VGPGRRRIQTRQSDCTITQERTGSLINRTFVYYYVEAAYKNFHQEVYKTHTTGIYIT